MRNAKPAIGRTHSSLGKSKGRQPDGPAAQRDKKLTFWRLSLPVPSWLPLSLPLPALSPHPRPPPAPPLLPLPPPAPPAPPPPPWVRALQRVGYESPRPPHLPSPIPPAPRPRGSSVARDGCSR